MVKHKPKITTVSMSKRVIEETRNVRVTAWIYAASREDDNDFHLIVWTCADQGAHVHHHGDLGLAAG